MKRITVYGLQCDNEKDLIKKIQNYLSTEYRAAKKEKNSTLLERFTPFVFDYFYWNQNKTYRTWIDLYKNQDTLGRWLWPDSQDCSWILHTYIYDDSERSKAENFLNGFLLTIPFDRHILFESDEVLPLEQVLFDPQKLEKS